jgi:CBS domain-containing protein/nucleotide-binding universal stress UspA family protein
MQLIKDVMTSQLHTIGPGNTLAKASELMAEHLVGALPVWQGGELLGIITDRDITVRAVGHGGDPRECIVGDFMTKQVVTCYEDQSIEEAARLMGWHQVRRLVVLDRQDRLAGIVTVGDLAVEQGHERLISDVVEQVALKRHTNERPFHHILVALDGSRRAEQVLTQVEALAEQFHSSVTLLRAVSAHELAATAPIAAGVASESHPVDPVAIQVSPDMRWDAVSYLNQIEHRLMQKGIEVRSETPEGRPATAIVHRARHLGADLIAMTTHGRGMISRVVFGSVATEVLHDAPCPVLLVRAQDE